MFISSNRKRKRIRETKEGGRAELDSHADTGCAGPDCAVLTLTGTTVNVYPFSAESNKVAGIPIGTVAYAVTDSVTGDTVLLIMHEQLIFGDRLPYSLLNPNQLRAYGVKVDDIPKQYEKSSLHSISVNRDSGFEPFKIPLEMNGVISYFNVRKPTPSELEPGRCERLELTSEEPWDPSSPVFGEREAEARSVYASFAARNTSISGEGWNNSLNRKPLSMEMQQRHGERLIAALQMSTIQNELPLECRDDSFISSTTKFQDVQRDYMSDRLISAVQVAATDRLGYGLDGWEAAGNPVREFVSNENRQVFATTTTARESVITNAILAKRWGISLETASRTLNVTTQAGIRKIVQPLERRFKSFQKHLNYPTLQARYYSDTMFAKTRSIRGYSMGQVFTDGRGDTHFYPMKKNKDAGFCLKAFILENGAPAQLRTDYAREEGHGYNVTDTLWNKIVDDFMIHLSASEPYSHWQNLCESEIRELKRGTYRFLRRANTPKRLWCYCAEWYAGVRRLTALDIHSLKGRVPEERRVGDTPDISEYAQFDWYDWVEYYEPAEAGDKEAKSKLGRFCGVAKNVGPSCTYWILTAKATVVARSTVTTLSDERRRDPAWQEQMAEYQEQVKAKIGDHRNKEEVAEEIGVGILPEIPDDLFDELEEIYNEANVDAVEPEALLPEVDNYTADTIDAYLSAEVILPRGGVMSKGKVIKRSKNSDLKPVGLKNENPILDTREYEVEFEDGEISTYQANLISEHLHASVDEQGMLLQLMKGIIDHRSDGRAVKKDDGFLKSKCGNSVPRKTTIGWNLLIEWKDGTTSWLALKDIKDTYSVQVAEYAVNNKIAEEPAFNWWVRPVLKKRDRIIMKVKKAYQRRTHKFGIRVPMSVEEALRFDEESGTTFWKDAIEKEMKNVRIAFKFRDGDIVPIGHKKIPCHIIFDVKMMTLQRKARLVAGGHMTDPPKENVYSSVVSRDSVRLAFLAAALNDLDVLAADIQNAYLTAPTMEKVYTIAGPEFGSDAGRPAVIVRALYGLRSSGKMFREHFAKTLREELQFVPCRADPDVWMRKATKAGGFQYWEYILVYVDDVLVVSEHPGRIMEAIGTAFTIKPGSMKEPDLYLGADISKHFIHDSDEPTKVRWAMSCDNYVATAVKTVEESMKDVGAEFLPKAKIETPCTSGYRPELDNTAELDPERLNYYQGLIGVLRWICELGRLDIVLPVSLMSRYLANPRWGHLQQVLHIFGYLKKYSRSKMVFDETWPDFAETSNFGCGDWSEYYPDAREAIPLDMPGPRGNPVTMSAFVDADHAGDTVTRRSHTGLIIFVNRAPIIWYSKKQNTVETSTFGSEFVAMRTAVEIVEGLRYKLRMMGFPLEGPTNVFCDNSAVVANSSKPESTLKKKHLSIAYHRCREAQAAGTIQVAKEGTETNISDLFTKFLTGTKLRTLCSFVLW
jgi:hypothetical protein